MERFWSRVNKAGKTPPEQRDPMSSAPNTPCWEWTGLQTVSGYGRLRFQGRMTLAHRASWVLFFEGEPTHRLDHLCRNKVCVNPEHLEDVTIQENTRRGLSGIPRTHCRRGHELRAGNIYLPPGSQRRQCKTCKMMGQKVRRDRLKRAHGNGLVSTDE